MSVEQPKIERKPAPEKLSLERLLTMGPEELIRLRADQVTLEVRDALIERLTPKMEDMLYVTGLLGDLGLTPNDLEGKRVLDIGAGHAKVAEVCRERGSDVISLDIDPEKWTDGSGAGLPNVPYVQADMVQLPFRDDEFDLVISRAGPLDPSRPFMSGDYHVAVDEMGGYIREAMRVVRLGGELRFGPGDGKPASLRFLRDIDPRFEQRDSGLPSREHTTYYVLKNGETKEERENRERENREQFKRYVEMFGLTPGDLQGRILDVGAGECEFAQYVREHGLGEQIFSLAPDLWDDSERHYVRATADQIPFEDDSFDKVISYAAIPSTLSVEFGQAQDSPERLAELDKKLYQSLREMVRVARNEVQMGKVRKGLAPGHNHMRLVWDSTQRALERLRAEGMTVEVIELGEQHSSFDAAGNPTFSEPYYLIRITKGA